MSGSISFRCKVGLTIFVKLSSEIPESESGLNETIGIEIAVSTLIKKGSEWAMLPAISSTEAVIL
ncbi:hypothetical protein SALSENF001_41130 [Salmonella enterica subsp. enterica serovar Senftenberg]